MGQEAKRGRIEVRDVTHSYGAVKAVDGINVTLSAGAYCAVLGPSGCGKTTLLRLIAGHEEPDLGDIRIDSRSVVSLRARQRPTAMMFQDFALFPHLSSVENVAFSLRMRGVGRRRRRRQAMELLEMVRMSEMAERMPAQLSGGQMQRVALARALIMQPRVLLLDEPLSALDEHLRIQMRNELRSVQRTLRITFVHVTHTNTEAIATSDVVVVMDQGNIDQIGPPREIFARPRTPYTARFLGGHNVIETLAGGNGKLALLLTDKDVVPLDCDRLGIAPGATNPTHMALRHDHVWVEDSEEPLAASGESIASFKSHVVSVEYEGSSFKLTVSRGERESFIVRLSDREFAGRSIEQGSIIHLYWRLEDLCPLTESTRGPGG